MVSLILTSHPRTSLTSDQLPSPFWDFTRLTESLASLGRPGEMSFMDWMTSSVTRCCWLGEPYAKQISSSM